VLQASDAADAALEAERSRARDAAAKVQAAAARMTAVQERLSADNQQLEAALRACTDQRDELHRVCIAAIVQVASVPLPA
jgi:hypothetical protein